MEDAEHFDSGDVEGLSIIGKCQTSVGMSSSNLSPTFQPQIMAVTNDGNERHAAEDINNILVDACTTQDPSVNDTNAQSLSDNYIEESWTLKLQKLVDRQQTWCDKGVRKARSPQLRILIYSEETWAIIDEGSDINCIDESLATKRGVRFEKTSCKAKAAGSSRMQLTGQTQDDVIISVKHVGCPILLRLGKMVVVKNLGVDLLLGEPAKIDNQITTIPHKRLIEVKNVKGVKVKLPYGNVHKDDKKLVFHCKASESKVIYPTMGVQIKLPSEFKERNEVAVIPKDSLRHRWIQPQIIPVGHGGSITITNNKDDPCIVSRLEHFADVVPCHAFSVNQKEIGNPVEDIKSETNSVSKVYDLGLNDLSHLIPTNQLPPNDEKDYIKEIVIDLDNILSEEWKKQFRSICIKFSHVITPRPGRYNGIY